MGFLDKYTQNEIEDKIRNSKNRLGRLVTCIDFG